MEEGNMVKPDIEAVAKRILPLVMISVIAIAISLVAAAAAAAEDFGCACHSDKEINFNTSLHHRIWGIYGEFNRGAGTEFNLTLPDKCAKCHVSSCTACHGAYPEHHKETKNMSTCVECHHARAGVNYEGYLGWHKKKGPSPDVHYTAGLNCTDCHSSSEIHGDGMHYTSEKTAVKVRCEDCHNSPGKTVKGMPVTQYSSDILAHRIHEDKLDCSACHAAWMQTCYNCHLETGKVDKSYVDKFYLGVGYEGKVKPFYYQRVTYKNKTYDRWVEWTPHTISAKAHDCDFCHNNKELLGANRTGKILGPPGASFIPEETIKRVLAAPFDTGSPSNPYPSIMGTHTGTIKPNHTVIAIKLYTYPCIGTGGHTEYARIWNKTWNATATWEGYAGGHNIAFDNPVVLLPNKTYNYTIRTGSYPQIHHNTSLLTLNGWINCTKFVDTNGKIYDDWIPAIRLE